MSSPSYETVAIKIAAIEDAMKRAGFWQSSPLDPAKMDFNQAFAADTMTFMQWLQFVFVARVKQIIENKEEFPSTSMVGTQAIREFDGWAEAGELVSLLCEFDADFD